MELNNQTWDGLDALAEGHEAVDPDRLLYGAYASCFHWSVLGDETNQARGEYLIARTATAIGRPEVALHHARRCAALVEAHRAKMADWDAAFAAEALARALAASGAREEAAAELARAETLAAAVADPEHRAVVDAERAKGPWFGLRPQQAPAP